MASGSVWWTMPSPRRGGCDDQHKMVDRIKAVWLTLNPEVIPAGTSCLPRCAHQKNDRPYWPVSLRFACGVQLVGFAHVQVLDRAQRRCRALAIHQRPSRNKCAVGVILVMLCEG